MMNNSEYRDAVIKLRDMAKAMALYSLLHPPVRIRLGDLEFYVDNDNPDKYPVTMINCRGRTYVAEDLFGLLLPENPSNVIMDADVHIRNLTVLPGD